MYQSEPNSSLVNENLAQTMSHYGTVLKLQGKVAEGVAAYERALAHDPKVFSVWFDRLFLNFLLRLNRRESKCVLFSLSLVLIAVYSV